MFQKIQNRIKLAAIAAPIMAADIDLKPPAGPTWGNLPTLTIGGIISGLIGLVMLVVALVFFFILVLGGLKWVTSEGDEKKVGAARAQITNALIGLAIVFAAWAIMKLIDTVFGINIFGGLNIPRF